MSSSFTPPYPEPYFEIEEDLAIAILNIRHAPELFELVQSSKESLSRWLPWVGRVKTLAHEEAWVNILRKRYFDNGALNAVVLENGKVAGALGINDIDWVNRGATIGYWLGKAFRGRGLMVRACARLIDYTFHDLDLHKVTIRCAVGNEASRRIPLQLGFLCEGVLREAEALNGGYVDLLSYSVLKREWSREGTP